MGPFLSTIMYFALAVVIVVAGLAAFALLTSKYRDWEEIQNGNRAVALSVGGKIVGICIILAFAVYNSFAIRETLIWGIVGVVLQLVAYLLFELLTVKFSVQEELKKGNIAVAVVSFSVSVGLAVVIGASIT